jgi:hypothetical protein
VEPVLVPARFNGPAGSGNGGWVSGRLAAVLEPGPDDAVRVVLRSPPPLGVPLQVQAGADGGLSAWSGDVLVATVNRVPSPFGVPAPDPVGWAVAVSAAGAYAGAVDHPFPTCFVCGPRREPGDGLRLTPGRLPARPTDTAAAWLPDASLAGAGSDRVDLAACWAALDCPGGWSLDLVGRPMVLGTMTAQVRELPRIGGRYVVVGRALGQQGRKAFTETVLYDASEGGVEGSGSTAPDAVGLGSGAWAVPGAAVPLARATSVWLRVDPATVRPA